MKSRSCISCGPKLRRCSVWKQILGDLMVLTQGFAGAGECVCWQACVSVKEWPPERSCEAGVFSNPRPHLRVPPGVVWRWSWLVRAIRSSFLQWFGSLGWLLMCISFHVVWPPLLKVLHKLGSEKYKRTTCTAQRVQTFHYRETQASRKCVAAVGDAGHSAVYILLYYVTHLLNCR